jgi:hypothetical protein
MCVFGADDSISCGRALLGAFVDGVTGRPPASGIDACATRQPELKERLHEMLKRHFQIHVQVLGAIEVSVL